MKPPWRVLLFELIGLTAFRVGHPCPSATFETLYLHTSAHLARCTLTKITAGKGPHMRWPSASSPRSVHTTHEMCMLLEHQQQQTCILEHTSIQQGDHVLNVLPVSTSLQNTSTRRFTAYQSTVGRKREAKWAHRVIDVLPVHLSLSFNIIVLHHETQCHVDSAHHRDARGNSKI